ncbi:hypothetical protein AAFN85_03120 [Mucilaginibacter sp. CAU 1740]|uniref:hypothetical protein n=1 Tax=Mucilaginibacter sp. CAU 1740 TaxID=3140365 RepID=UPI00325AF9F6
MRGLEFYNIELNILQEWLEEIAAGNTGQEAAEGVGHFQNQLLIHHDYINGLKDRIQTNLEEMTREAEEAAGYLKEGNLSNFALLEEQYDTEEKLIKELRKEFNRFAAKWL